MLTPLLEDAIGAIADPTNRDHCLKLCHDAVVDHMLGIPGRQPALSDLEAAAELRVCTRMALALRDKIGTIPTRMVDPRNIGAKPTVKYITPPNKKPAPTTAP